MVTAPRFIPGHSALRSVRLTALLVLCLSFALPGRIEAANRVEAVDRSALRVCADPSNLPFSNEKGEGFENKIAELLAKKMQVPLRYVWYPNSVGFLRNTLRARQCDLVLGIVSGAEMVQTTNPYYRSAYVIVTRTADKLDMQSLDDPRLRNLKIGLTAGTPPADIAVRMGLIGNVIPYQLVIDTRYDAPGKQMIEDLRAKKIDVALLWGPIAGYFARDHKDELEIRQLSAPSKNIRLDFYIAMGVRPGESNWKNDINNLLRQNQDEITGILRDYNIPLIDNRGQLQP
ncbi:substrate-binding domain-containing protein [Dongia soli]|uniref:Substrate-binding domain-containing protein n=1 Tax=Dongia soli TaxID=600628 RepID=A0ABU5EL55_9PROT|nr:substrate-binding domain-containing protein [Dongia soli]MDY0885813.1 substrate-binding domain-containing protein [Dongia soli]